MQKRGVACVNLRRSVMDACNRALQADLAKSAWATNKTSWCKPADGTITNNGPHGTIRYRRQMRRADLDVCETLQ